MFITEEYVQKYLSWKSPNSRLRKDVRSDILAEHLSSQEEACPDHKEEAFYKQGEKRVESIHQ